ACWAHWPGSLLRLAALGFALGLASAGLKLTSIAGVIRYCRCCPPLLSPPPTATIVVA
ncbi:hypothetical protein ACLOJK_019998, partial [Asimina triloba]